MQTRRTILTWLLIGRFFGLRPARFVEIILLAGQSRIFVDYPPCLACYGRTAHLGTVQRVPVDKRKYVHRVGRTARAMGDAWTLIGSKFPLKISPRITHLVPLTRHNSYNNQKFLFGVREIFILSKIEKMQLLSPGWATATTCNRILKNKHTLNNA